MSYKVIIRVVRGSWSEYLQESDKSRIWVEEQIAAPRREGRDILFAGKVLNWRVINTIQIFESSQPTPSPYDRGRRNSNNQYIEKDVTHEFIAGAPGAQAVRAEAGASLTAFSDDELIEELRRRLGQQRSKY